MKKSTRELIAVLLGGGQLNPLEAAELAAFDPDSLNSELQQTREQLREYEKAKLSGEEALRLELAEVGAERDALRLDRDLLLRRQRIAELAVRSGCEEPDYLDFLAARADLDLNDDGAVAGFLADAEKKNPHCFKSTLMPGGGSNAAAELFNRGEAGAGAPPPADRMSRIISELGSAPEISGIRR